MVLLNIAADERRKQKAMFFLFLHENICCGYSLEVPMFFLFLHENICCGYSLEVPRRGTSNEYPQHIFSWRNKKNTNVFWLEKASLLEIW